MRNYCLYCFARMPRGEHLCGQCGRNSFPSERRVYWNLHPRLVELEATLKWLIALLTMPACFFLVRAASGPGAGWLFAAPVFPATALWMTASLLTHRGTYFSPRWVWGSVFSLMGLMLLWIGWGELDRVLWLVIAAFVAALLALGLCEIAARWRDSLIAGNDE